MQLKVILLWFIVFKCTLSASSQNVSIEGKAHASYKGKLIKAYSEVDHITHLQRLEATDTIDTEGYFDLHLYNKETQRIKLKIEQATMDLYIQPDFVYGITVPELDQAYNYNNDSELFLNIGVIGNDSTELNALIMDFEKIYNQFFAGDEGRFLSRPMMFRRIDSLQKTCDLRYQNINNSYFKSHVKYTIASVNASVSRGEYYLINGYILNQPILYNNEAYMDFFASCYTGYLNVASTAKAEQSLQDLINSEKNADHIDVYFKTDRFLKKDSIRELVILQNLWQFYFIGNYDTETIKKIIASIQHESKIEEHRKICSNMLTYMNKLLIGSDAPQFSARAANAKMGSLQMFKGRWIYLNFFSTKNAQSMREMPKIADLKKQFGDKLVFLSICLDDSVNTYMNYVRSNPKFNWPIWFNNEKRLSKTAKEAYFVSGTEAYFLINSLGALSLSPAPSPSEGIEYRLNLIFKPKRKNTRTGIR